MDIVILAATIIALVLAVVEQLRARGQSLLAWAVIILTAAPLLLLVLHR